MSSGLMVNDAEQSIRGVDLRLGYHGTTVVHGRTSTQVLPVAIALLVITPAVVAARRELDLMTLDDDTPRVLGVRRERTRLVALGAVATPVSAPTRPGEAP
jgi:ABC-type Fe3+-siderophore transport system permease subunit